MIRRRATIAYLVVLVAVAVWLVTDRGSAMVDLVGQARPWPLLGLRRPPKPPSPATCLGASGWPPAGVWPWPAAG